ALPISTMREQQHSTNRCRIRQQHHQTVNTNSKSARWRHTIFKRMDEVIVHLMSLIITVLALNQLSFETLTLINRVIQLGKCVGMLASYDKQLETIREPRIFLIFLRQW